LVGYGEAKGTPVVRKVLVEEVLGPQIIGEDPTRVEFVWEKLYSASRQAAGAAARQPISPCRQPYRSSPRGWLR
jgi:L-alanine-DL-glutamate epimerase-like enolase superfamily enzyme